MPLWKKKPYPLSPPPQDLKPDELVFQVRFTREVFRSYEEYLAKINLYRQRIWVCKASGTADLTYEEALVSELEGSQKIQHFPSHFMGPVLHMVQFSQDRLENLVDTIFKRFKFCYVEGEEVGAWRNGDVYRCKILKVLLDKTNAKKTKSEYVGGLHAEFPKKEEPEIFAGEGNGQVQGQWIHYDIAQGGEAGMKSCYKYVGSLVGACEETDFLRYEVGWMSAGMKEIVETTIEHSDNLIRKRYPITKGHLKTFIKESATGPTKSSYWLVRDHLAVEYGISSTPPEEYQEVVKRVKQEKKSKKSGIEPTPKAVKWNGKKKDVEKIVKEEDNGKAVAMEVDEDKESRKTRKKKRPAADMVEGEELKNSVWKRKKEEVSNEQHNSNVVKTSPKRPKYPIEDTLVEPVLVETNARPTPSKDFLLPEECTGDLLAVWDFCCTYARTIHLSPFSLDDFEHALLYEEETVPLLAEIHTALVKVAFGSLEQYKRQGKKLSEMSIRTWQEDICTWISISKQTDLYRHEFTIRKHYVKLPPTVKLTILQKLVDTAVGTELVRVHIDECEEAFHDLVAQRREEEVEERRKKDGEDGQSSDRDNLNGTPNGILCEEGNMESESDDHDNVHKGLPASWQKKGKRKSNCFRNPRPFSDSSSTENGTSLSLCDPNQIELLRARSRQHSLKKAVNLREIEVKEKAQQVQEEQRALAEKRREKQESLLERKKLEQERLLQQKKVGQLEKDCDKCLVRTSPLGRDRQFNRYWFFPREGRVFVEGASPKSWGFYAAIEEINSLHETLNPKGVRERELKKQMDKLLPRIRAAVLKRTKDTTLSLTKDEAALRRSTRVHSTSRLPHFFSYSNRLATVASSSAHK